MINLVAIAILVCHLIMYGDPSFNFIVEFQLKNVDRGVFVSVHPSRSLHRESNEKESIHDL